MYIITNMRVVGQYVYMDELKYEDHLFLILKSLKKLSLQLWYQSNGYYDYILMWLDFE